MVLLALCAFSIFVYVIKKYKCEFLLDSFKPSSFERARNPIYMRYMYSLIHKRLEIHIEQHMMDYQAMA